ncbi:uncharacterized protein VTP21DRAFT_1587 [Calcarisporiella thermophila]|uniref:uncharacterized protein n=1 Tax=Calcarisporiella thermophila TaxID=911321 RepID=UPI003742B8D1
MLKLDFSAQGFPEAIMELANNLGTRERAVLSAAIVASVWPIVLPLGKSLYERYLTSKHKWVNSTGEDVNGPPVSLPHGSRFERFSRGKAMTREYYEQYGHVYRIWNGSLPELVLSSSDDIAVYYKDSK